MKRKEKVFLRVDPWSKRKSMNAGRALSEWNALGIKMWYKGPTVGQETDAIAVLTFYMFVLWLDTWPIKEKLSVAPKIIGKRKPRCLGALLTNPESFMAEQSPQHKAARKGNVATAKTRAVLLGSYSRHRAYMASRAMMLTQLHLSSEDALGN